MEYSIYINQVRAIEWKLSHSEAWICSYYSQSHSWVKSRIKNEEGDYLCIALTKLINELPFIGNTKTPFSKALNSLVSKNILEKKIDEDNCRIVYYRMNPAFKVAWKYHEAILSTDLQSRFLVVSGVIKDLQVLSNDNSITKRLHILSNDNSVIKDLQVLSNDNEVLSNDNEVLSNDNEVLSNDNEVLSNDNLSNNIISNNQSNNHNHNNQDEDYKSSKITNIEKEFNKLLSHYPETVNNKPENIAKAFGTYQSLSSANRLLAFKAVCHYAKTNHVYSKQHDTRFIQGIHSFLTKGNFTERLKEPLYKDFSESLEKNFDKVGAVSVGTYYDEKDSIEYVKLCGKFKQIKELKTINEEEIKNILGVDFGIFFDEMGLGCVSKYSHQQLAESLIDLKKDINA